MEIQTSKEGLRRASAIARGVELKHVLLRSLDADLSVSTSELKSKQIVTGEQQGTGTWSYDAEKGELTIITEFRTTFSTGSGEQVPDSTDSGGEPFARVKAEYHLIYSCRFPTDGPSDAALDDYLRAFAEVNAVYNAWPFYRELLHNTMSRMGVPSPELPLLRVVTVDPASDEDDATGDESGSEVG